MHDNTSDMMIIIKLKSEGHIPYHSDRVHNMKNEVLN